MEQGVAAVHGPTTPEFRPPAEGWWDLYLITTTILGAQDGVRKLAARIVRVQRQPYTSQEDLWQ